MRRIIGIQTHHSVNLEDASRFAVKIHPLHTRKTADTGRSARVAAIWRRLRSKTPWTHPLNATYA